LYREENSDNRRQKLVFPTDKANEIRENLHNELKSANEAMLDGLDEKEKKQLMQLMTKVIDSCRDKLGMTRVWDLL